MGDYFQKPRNLQSFSLSLLILKMNNGRVNNILYDKNYDIYKLYEEEKKPQKHFQHEAIKGMHQANDISRVFFSEDNINAVQDAIRYQVYIKSCKKHIIDRQSDNDLKVIMRATYMEHAMHNPPSPLKEIKRLNMIVLTFCVPKIIQEINMYMRYREDISKLPMPLDRSEMPSVKGTKSLITKEF